MLQTDIEQASRQELIRRISSSKFIVNALHLAAKEALLDHKRTGDPIAVWHDNRVVWIPASEINIQEVDRLAS